MRSTIEADLNRFYRALKRLETSLLQGKSLGELSGRSGLPQRGVYFFREPDERRRDAATFRVVRVGTHAVSAGSKATLWGRLRAHRGTLSGSGNHRGSIFRQHVGSALLVREKFDNTMWGRGSSVPAALRADPDAMLREKVHEKIVSTVLAPMTVLWVAVPDEAGPTSARALIERNAIGLLSNRFDPVDVPSPTWLGRHSLRSEIARSGLWNLDYVDGHYDPDFLDTFDALVDSTVAKI